MRYNHTPKWPYFKHMSYLHLFMMYLRFLVRRLVEPLCVLRSPYFIIIIISRNVTTIITITIIITIPIPILITITIIAIPVVGGRAGVYRALILKSSLQPKTWALRGYKIGVRV